MVRHLQPLLDYFQRIHPRQIDLDLSRVDRVLKVLGAPHLRLPPTIHVAGTNGKGSTISYLRHIYEAAGLKVHVYTSPHLIRHNERIRLSGALITDEQLAFYLDRVRKAADTFILTFFEAKTVAAFLAFCEHPADVLLLETGLGGRLDATNVIGKPLACVLTPISLDHQEFLGNSLAEIAQEKAGIIKSEAMVFIGEQHQQVQHILIERAYQLQAKVYAKDREWLVESLGSGKGCLHFPGQSRLIFRPTLVGKHQLQNAGLAAAVTVGLQGKLPVSEPAIVSGIENAVWPGRLQRLIVADSGAEIWLDGAHNADGFQALGQFLQEIQQEKKIVFCVSMLKNRDPQLFFQAFDKFVDQFIFVGMPEGERFHTADFLAIYTNKPSETLPVEKLNELFREKRLNDARIFVTGSLYLVGKVLELNQTELD